MIRTGFLLLIFLVLFSCKKTSEDIVIVKPKVNLEYNDSLYVIYNKFKRGDVRRYGIFPNQPISKTSLNKVMKLAQSGVEIFFPKGYYNTNIVLKKASDITFDFDSAILTGTLQIIDEEEVISQRIQFKGMLTVLDNVFIRKSKNIAFDTLVIKSDTIKNIHRRKNKGFSIYAGSKNIKIKKLSIYDTGGNSDDFYKYSAAAFQVHGYNNNPANLSIDKLEIKNAARTAMYLTGNNHRITKIEIEEFGLGSNKNIFGLEDAKPKSETKFVGAWFNKCNDCTVDTLIIDASAKSKKYSARFDLGVYSQPCIINNIMLKNLANTLPIIDDELTNVLVKNILD